MISVQELLAATVILHVFLRGVKVLAYVVMACSAAYQLASDCQTIYCRR